MKHFFADFWLNLAVCFCACLSCTLSQLVAAESNVLPYWRDVQVTSVNTIPPHAAYMTYANRAQALSGRYAVSYTHLTLPTNSLV